MAAEIRQFAATIPKGTPKATLYTVAFDLDYRIVSQIDLEVPTGPSGLMGFFLAHSGTQLIPMEVGQFIVWNDIEREWPLSDYPTSQGWSLSGYNLDAFNDHTVTVRFHVDVPVVPSSVTPALIVTDGAPLASVGS